MVNPRMVGGIYMLIFIYEYGEALPEELTQVRKHVKGGKPTGDCEEKKQPMDGLY